ncbi:MAG: DUF4345 domain-containing protein [Pseudomonadota bacterium]
MRQVVTRLSLAASGALLGVIGGALMVDPQAFLQMSHVIVDRDPGLMSELTAPSGLLLLSGAFMVFGALKLRFSQLALIIGALVYGSYGIVRGISMGLHGLPSESLISATMIELAIAICLSALGLTQRAAQDAARIDTPVFDLNL